MINANTFLLILLGILCSILLVILIILSIKLIYTVDRVNKVMDEVNIRISKFDKAFNIVDIITDNMALVSDKLVDGISGLIRKIITKKEKRKEEEINE